MQKYPQIGEQVRVKNETGLLIVTNVIEPGRIELNDGRALHVSEIVTRHQKWVTVYVIQQHYGSGWEDVTQEETITEAIQRRKEYRENTNYPTRLIRRKEPNTLYQK
jgi:hypothetical protein